MNKEFIPYEQALELKELGFDEPCLGYYEPSKEFNYLNWETFKDFPYLAKNSEWQDLCGAPLYQQAFRWFREKNKLHVVVDINISDEWCFSIFNLNSKRNAEVEVLKKDEYYNTYEEAEIACLNKLIEIVKQ
jgi:hypothetical protein